MNRGIEASQCLVVSEIDINPKGWRRGGHWGSLAGLGLCTSPCKCGVQCSNRLFSAVSRDNGGFGGGGHPESCNAWGPISSGPLGFCNEMASISCHRRGGGSLVSQ